MRNRYLVSMLLILGAGCGAKTGLPVPTFDAGIDSPIDAVDVADTLDAPEVTDAVDGADVCAPRTQPVVRFSAEVIFVIDRSGSMAERTPSGVTRWEALTSSLRQVLPSVDRELWTGLVLYPTPGASSATQCAVPTGLTLTPRSTNASRILPALGGVALSGGTPTWAALRAAADYFSANPPIGPLRGRFLVLTTDGGPNCNESLNAASCVCTNPRGCFTARGNLSCLDDARTSALLRQLVSDGIPTFVVGTGSDTAVMNALAVAGGRARPSALGGTRYYRAEDTADFLSNFREITTGLVRCRFVTNPLPAGVTAQVRVGANLYDEDPTRVGGFAWERREAGEFSLNGAACEDAARSNGAVRIELPCAR